MSKAFTTTLAVGALVLAISALAAPIAPAQAKCGI